MERKLQAPDLGLELFDSPVFSLGVTFTRLAKGCHSVTMTL